MERTVLTADQPEEIAAQTFSLLMETRGKIKERLSLDSGVEREEEMLSLMERLEIGATDGTAR